MGSAICGGVMSDSMMMRGIKKYGAYFGMMSFVMPDKHYKCWLAHKKNGDEKKAKEIFDKYAFSVI